MGLWAGSNQAEQHGPVSFWSLGSQSNTEHTDGHQSPAQQGEQFSCDTSFLGLVPGAQDLERTYSQVPARSILSSLLLAMPTNTNKAVKPPKHKLVLGLALQSPVPSLGGLLVPSYLPGLSFNFTQDASTPPHNPA